jgi:hypothetical protein
MRVKPLLMAAAALPALAVATVAGCSTAGARDPATNGPLSSAASAHGRIPRGGNCVTFPPSTPAQAFGDQTFTNYGHVTVVLDRVILLHPHNERVIGSDVVPGKALIGVIEWPPNWHGIRAAWETRRPVHGYRVAPGKSFNMVIGAEPAGPGKATSQGLLLYYHDTAGSYVAPNYFAMDVAPGINGCSPN